MANVYTSSPILIDTAFSGSYKALVAASLGTLWTLRIGKVLWQSPGVIGDVVLIIDPQTGRERLRLTCEVALQSQVIDLNGEEWADFSVPQMSSGRLEIRLK